MKVAIALPDALSTQAEQLAAQLGTSRSQFCSEALHEFVARNPTDAITAAIDGPVDPAG